MTVGKAETADIPEGGTKADETITYLTQARTFWVFEVPPVVSDDIVQGDKKHRAALAKDGDYMPVRACEPVINFASTNSYYRFTIADENEYKSNVMDGPKALKLLGWSVGVQLYDGIDKTASVRMLRREGMEIRCGSGTSFAPFEASAACRDERALAVVSEFARTQPHSWPADYNHKNGLLSNIVNGLGSAIGNLGIPLISDVAPGLGNLLSNILPF